MGVKKAAPLNPVLKTLHTDRGTLEYVLKRKKMKTIRLKVEGDKITVSCSMAVPQRDVEDFLLRHWQWIENARKKQRQKKEGVIPETLEDGERFHYLGAAYTIYGVPSGRNGAELAGGKLLLHLKADTPEARRKAFDNWLNKNIKSVFEERFSSIYPVFSREIGAKPALVLRRLKSRWGSAHIAKRQVTLNTALIHAPVHLIDYVIAHEFAHFIHANHSKEYYSVLAAYMPDWKQRKKALKEKYMARG